MNWRIEHPRFMVWFLLLAVLLLAVCLWYDGIQMEKLLHAVNWLKRHCDIVWREF